MPEPIHADAPFAAPAAPRVLVTSRGPVEYAEEGSGPAVVSLHGAMGGHDQSQLLARTIAGTGWRHLALSRPGSLGTPLDCGRTPEAQADLAAEVLDRLRIDDAAVLAVSGGGPSAIAFALRHPDRCRALVLVSTVGMPIATRIPLAFHLMRWLLRVPPIARRMEAAAQRDPAAAVERSIRDPGIRARTLADPEAGPLLLALNRSTATRMADRLPGTWNDIRVARTFALPLHAVRVPTLVVHGTDDVIAPYAHGARLAAAIAGADHLRVEGGEHVAIFSHRAQVRPRVMAFLAAHAES